MPENKQQKQEIVVSFDDVKMKDFRAYWKAVAQVDWAGQDAFFAKVVKSWSFEGDPNVAHSFGELTLDEYTAIQSEIKKLSDATVKTWRRNKIHNSGK